MKNLTKLMLALLLPPLVAGCTICPCTSVSGSEGPAVIYPDYKGVTVPCNIAPLNFHYAMKGATTARTTFSCGGKSVRISGLKVEWGLRRWKRFIAGADTVTVAAAVKAGGRTVTDSWQFFVSPDKVDPYLTYRLIEPAYQMWDEVQIRERCIEDFSERPLCDHAHTDNACMNCHVHGQQRGELSLFYIRGPHGGAILNRGGELRKLNLNAPGMLSGTVYGEIHPSGHFGVFSTNIVIPGLHAKAPGRMEVYDTASDLAVADFDENRILDLPHVAGENKLETFPCFSPDGGSVFYCVAPSVKLPEELRTLKYSLVRAEFDSLTGQISESVDTIWSAERHNASVCHPKVSPDGKRVMYTVSEYGTFPINHSDCTLRVTDLETGEELSLDGVKGNGSDTWHSWSSDGRWFVFASKRGDGQYGKPWFCHLGPDGTPTKPFVLPQKSSTFYENNLKSFNIPDLGRDKVPFSIRDIPAIFSAESEEFRRF